MWTLLPCPAGPCPPQRNFFLNITFVSVLSISHAQLTQSQLYWHCCPVTLPIPRASQGLPEYPLPELRFRRPQIRSSLLRDFRHTPEDYTAPARPDSGYRCCGLQIWPQCRRYTPFCVTRLLLQYRHHRLPASYHVPGAQPASDRQTYFSNNQAVSEMLLGNLASVSFR